MQRNYGCDLYSFVHQPISQALQPLIQYKIQEAFRRWIPEVRLQSCAIQESKLIGQVTINITYIVLREQNLDQVQIDLASQGI